MIRKLLFPLMFLLTFPAFAQFTNVTATVPTLQTASYTWDFVNQSSGGPPLLGGISVFPTQVVGSFDGNGHMSVSLATNSQVLPLPSQWQINIVMCKGDPSGPIGFNIQVTVAGTTQDISSALNAALPPIPMTCNGGGVGGVNKIIAGTNVTISPPSGTGNVTINAVGGSGSAWDLRLTPAGSSGIVTYFGSTPNLVGIVTPQTTDTTIFPPTSGSVIGNFIPTGGLFGDWFTNCNSRDGFSIFPNLPFVPGADKGCETIWANQNIASSQSESAPAASIFNTTTEFPGYDIGNPGFLQGPDNGWAGMLGVGINSVNWSQGINNTLTLGSYKNAAGDQNILEITGSGVGGCTAASDQCITPLGINVIQTNGFPFGTIATTTGFGDTNPTYTLGSGAINTFGQGSPGGPWIVETSNLVAAGTMVSSGGRFNTTGVLTMFLSAGTGSGQTPSQTFTLTSVNGSGVYQGTITGGAGNAWAGYPFSINGFTNTANNTPQGFTFVATASTATSITFAQTTVPETHAGTALQLFPIVCTGGGGSGATGWGTFVTSGGLTETNAFQGSPGSGYTSSPTCVTTNVGGSNPAAYLAELTTPLHALNIAGATLTPTPNQCILTTYIPRSAVDMVNQNFPITCAVQSGTMSTTTNGGVMWIASDAEPEMVKVVSVGAQVGNSLSLVVSSHLPHPTGSMMFQGGSSGVLCLDAQAAGDAATQPWPFCVPAYGSSNSSTVIYGWLFGGTQINGSLPSIGTMRASFTSPNNGFHIYKGAQIISTTNQGTVPTLNVNDVTFAPGDGFESPPNAAFGLTAITTALDQQEPLGPSGGAQVAILGHGPNWVNGWNPLIIDNENHFGMYENCDVTSTTLCLPITTSGGWAVGSDFINLVGPYRHAIDVGGVPLPGGTVITMNDGANTATYNLLTTEGGTIQVVPSQTEFFLSQNLGVGGFIFAGNGITSGSSIAANSTVTAPQGLIFGNHTVGTAQIFQNNQSGSQPVFFPIGYATAVTSPPFLDTTASLSMGALHSALVYAGSPPPFSVSTFVQTPGSTSYSWEGKCVTQFGESLPTTTSISNGPAAITAINFVNIKAFPSPGCQSINIYRTSTTGGLTAGFLGNVTNGGNGTITDSGQTPSSGLTANIDTSGSLYGSVLNLPLANGCLDITSGVVGTTGSACGSGSSFITSLTTTGTSGPATVISGVLNIPQYTGGSGPTLETNGSSNSSQSVLNFVNPSTFNGLTITFSNPTGGNETFALGGTLGNAGLTNSATTVNGQTCTLGSTCTISTGLISGLTTGFIPKASSATALNNSHIDDGVTTASTVTITEPVVVNTGGPVNSAQLGTNVFSALPACTSGVEGTWAPVTDSTTNTWGATITGGGTDHVLAYCDSAQWTVAAK